MNSYDCRSIDNASYTCTIASNLIADSTRTTTRQHRQYLELLKVIGNACAIALGRSVLAPLKLGDNTGKSHSRRVELTNEQLASIPRDAAAAGMGDKRTAKPGRAIERTATQWVIDVTGAPKSFFMIWLRVERDRCARRNNFYHIPVNGLSIPVFEYSSW
jgi:hypothetical protein